MKSGSNSRGLYVTALNGFSSSTPASKRSASSSCSPLTLAVPPERKMRSMRSSELVALKKSKVFWISRAMFSDTACRMGCRLSGFTPSTRAPFFSASAWSKDRLRSFWMASVYWLPPTAMSRLKMDVPPLMMLMFMIEAPTFSSAMMRPASMP